MVLRLFEASGARRAARVSFPSFRPRRAVPLNLLEDPAGEPIDLQASALEVNPAPGGYATFRLDY